MKHDPEREGASLDVAIGEEGETVMPNDLDKWLEQARALRAEMYASDARFMLFLVAGEQNTRLWKGAFTSYEQLLKDQELVDSSRYTAFRDALKVVDPARAESIGVDGVIKAGRVCDVQKRGTIVRTLGEWSKVHGHAPSAETVERIVQQISPRESVPRVLQQALSRDKLEAENKSLRARVKELEAQVIRLKKELVAAKKVA
jgi:hypothetical protein